MLKQLLVLATASLSYLAAAAYSVNGTVIDAQAEPEAFATVRVFSVNDMAKPVVMGITEDDG